jgi:hypothetical protein
VVAAAVMSGAWAPREASAVTLDLTSQEGQAIRQSGKYSDATLGDVTFIAGPSGSTFTWVDGAGLGVRCQNSSMCFRDSAHAINAFETVRIEFESTVEIGYITLSNMWSVQNDLVVDLGVVEGESFAATLEGDSDGWVTAVINRDVRWIEFSTPNAWNYNYQLATISFATPTPEPSAPILFGIGLLTVLLATRRYAR